MYEYINSYISIAVMLVGCGNINNSNEAENYATEEIDFNYDSETKSLKQYPTFSKGEAIEFTYDFDCKEYTSESFGCRRM